VICNHLPLSRQAKQTISSLPFASRRMGRGGGGIPSYWSLEEDMLRGFVMSGFEDVIQVEIL
jgi:hypothetical protein